MLTVLGMIAVLTACGSSGGGDKAPVTPAVTVVEEIPPSVADTDNYLAYINIDVIGVTTDCVTVNVQGGDDDGVTKVDTYIIDAYKSANNIPNYVVQKVSRDFDASKDTAFDFDIMFEGLYDNKLYIVRTVAYTVNGMTVTEEKVSMNNYVRTDANPVPVPAPTPEPTPTPTPEPEPEPEPDPDPVTNTAPTCEDFTVDAVFANTFVADLTPYMHDADVGDILTANYEGSGRNTGDVVVSSADVVGNEATITVSSGTGEGYVDYTVSDGTDISIPCRVIFDNLDGN